MKIYLVSADGRVSNIAMEYALALEKVVSGQAEEVYADPRDMRSFKGIRLIDRSLPSRPAFHRPSLETSNTAITHDTSIKNAGYFFIEGPLQRECIDAHEMVEAWPDEYDRNAVVISAGKVRGATLALAQYVPVCGFRAVPDNQPNEQADNQDVPLLELIGRMVDAALQAHGVYSPEVSNTVGQILKVADELSKPEFVHDEHYLRYGMIDFKQMYGIKPETLFRALAIYKQAIADLCGLTIDEVEKEIRKYRVE